VQFLKARSGKSGNRLLYGGCADAASLVHVPEIDAGVVWYGCPRLEYIDATRSRRGFRGIGHADEFFRSPASIGWRTNYAKPA